MPEYQFHKATDWCGEFKEVPSLAPVLPLETFTEFPMSTTFREEFMGNEVKTQTKRKRK